MKLDLVALGFTPEEAEYLKTLHWQMVLHMSAGEGNTISHQVKKLGVGRAAFTPKTQRHPHDAIGRFGKTEVTYFVEGEKDEFATMAEALKCLRDRHPGRIVKAMREAGFKLKAAG